ncbi:MAG: adenylyl-sulfate kinase, partial [Terracidiphilus sp.]
IRRVTDVARLFVDAGLIVLVSFISPFRAERELARSRFGENEFKEIFIDTPLAECELRDPKGLYAKARRGEIRNFTGIDSEYEPPLSPDLRLKTQNLAPEECVNRILELLRILSGSPLSPLRRKLYERDRNVERKLEACGSASRNPRNRAPRRRGDYDRVCGLEPRGRV